MSARPVSPQLEAPDLSPPPRETSSRPPTTAADDPRFDAASRLETHAVYVQGVKEGRVRVVNPETMPPRPDVAAHEPQRRRSPESSLSTKYPNTSCNSSVGDMRRVESPSGTRSSSPSAMTACPLRTTIFRTSASGQPGRRKRGFGVTGFRGFGVAGHLEHQHLSRSGVHDRGKTSMAWSQA